MSTMQIGHKNTDYPQFVFRFGVNMSEIHKNAFSRNCDVIRKFKMFVVCRMSNFTENTQPKCFEEA